MDSFDIKVEKANAILRYKKRQNIAAFFRFMEVCIFLFIISRFSTQLPFTFKLSGDYFRRLFITIFSPGFIFILGNAIVLLLFLLSGKLPAQETRNFNITIDLCNESVESCQKRVNINHIQDIKEQGKQGKCNEKEVVNDFFHAEDNKMHRSHSVNLNRFQEQESSRKLRRSATTTSQKAVNYGGETNAYAEDEMSSEEFRRKVEDFIARQQRSLREEEYSAIVTFDR